MNRCLVFHSVCSKAAPCCSGSLCDASCDFMGHISTSGRKHLPSQLQGREVHFGSWLYRVQSMVGWLQVRNIMAEGHGREKWSLDGSQAAEQGRAVEKEEGLGSSSHPSRSQRK